MSELVVSLHDVSPLTRPIFEPMLAELARLGVERTSLLVVPDHHRRGHFLADAGFCRWLERLARAGHELVVHGYYHERPASGRESARARWLTSVYTAGEGEFFDLGQAEAAELLGRAKADFSRLDAPAPVGFIAPAWLLGKDAERAVRAAGFRYTTYLSGVKIFASEDGGAEKIHRAQSLVYSCRNRWRRGCSLGWNATLRWRLRHAPLLRLGLHPPDVRHAAIWRQIVGGVREEAARRRVVTYQGFVGDQGGRESSVTFSGSAGSGPAA